MFPPSGPSAKRVIQRKVTPSKSRLNDHGDFVVTAYSPGVGTPRRPDTGIERITASFLSTTHTHCNELLYTTRRPSPDLRGRFGVKRRVSVMVGESDGTVRTSGVAEGDPLSCEVPSEVLPSCVLRALTTPAGLHRAATHKAMVSRCFITHHPDLCHRPLRSDGPPNSRSLASPLLRVAQESHQLARALRHRRSPRQRRLRHEVPSSEQ